ncbi:hypothetical protein SLT67_12385 [Paenibacillus illinoisensis]|uniref:HNH endonuclease n=1 Tax=Paenibacillus illinoisensis TaxID=59845 RepID=UPI003CEA9356
MFKTYNKQDLFLRAALYHVYEGRCFYERVPIRFKDMHVDHIIPESITDKGEISRITKQLGLPELFDANALYNLVPCSPHENLSKNDDLYNIDYLKKLILDKSLPKVQSIKNKIENFKKEYNDDKKKSKLLAFLSEYDNKEKLEELYNQLANEEPYKEKREIIDNSTQYTFVRSMSNVKLVGNLPRYPNKEGNCLITFSNLRLRDCMITLNHKQIMRDLFEGVKTKLKYDLRSFILHQEKINPDIYYVDLANVRLPLEKNEVEQLTEIIDDFYDYYIKESTYIYNFFRKDVFESRNGKNRLKMIEINIDLWFQIKKFIRHFDYGKGDTQWHLFDATGSMIKVYDKKEREFRLFIYAEVEQEEFIVSSIRSVKLIWTDEFFLDKRLSNFSQNIYWSPEYTLHWLTEIFIPYVIYYYAKPKTKVLRRKIGYEKFYENFKINEYSLYQPNIKQTNDFEFIVGELQIFFTTYQLDVYPKQDLLNLYDCLILVIEKTDLDKNGLHYISSKLGVQGEYKKEILQHIKNLKNDLDEENKLSGFFIDMIFRGIIYSLTYHKNRLSIHEEDIMEQKLNLFTKKYLVDRVRREAYIISESDW